MGGALGSASRDLRDAGPVLPTRQGALHRDVSQQRASDQRGRRRLPELLHPRREEDVP